MMSRYHWIGAFILASLIHIALFMPFNSVADSTDVAKDVGEMGIEVDLGMLGDLGVAMVETAPDSLEQEVDPEPIIEDEPVSETIEEVQQPAEPKPVVKVFETPKKVIPKKETVKVKKQIDVKPKPKKVIKTVEPSVKPKPKSEQTKPVKLAVNSQSTQATHNNEAAKKITTGSQQAKATGGNKGAQQSYIATLSAKLARHKRYPNSARKRGQEGTVTLYFVVNRDGKVIESYISKSSGYKKLDDAVIRMLKKASPLPPFSDDMDQHTLTILIPIEFKLNDKR